MLFFICFILFINKVSLETSYYNDVDLKKYDKITVPVSSSSDNERFIIFDSSDFSEGSKIYFKITATDFIYDEIYFEFFDDPNAYIPKTYNELDYVYPKDTSTSSESVTNYYTIEKKSRYLGSLEGKYLIIYFYCYGSVEIENTKKDESLMISLIIVGIAIVVIIVVLIYCYCRKKKLMAAATKGNGTEDVQIDNNNYDQQQQMGNYQNNNVNMNMNMNMNGNNAYTYNNGYNNGYTSAYNNAYS